MGWKYWLPRQTLIVDLTFSSMEHVVRSVYLLFIKQKSPLVGNFSCTTDGIQGNVDFFFKCNSIDQKLGCHSIMLSQLGVKLRKSWYTLSIYII